MDDLITINIVGSWPGKTWEEITEVIDDALHAKGLCGCPGNGGYYVMGQMMHWDKEGPLQPDNSNPVKATVSKAGSNQ